MKHENKPMQVRVVLVDDSRIVRERIAQLLATVKGIKLVGQAPDIAASGALIEKLSPDVVLLDVSMPGGSGIELLQQIKRKANAPVVMMFTTDDDDDTRRLCFRHGADFFFSKPSEFTKALEACARLGRLYAQRLAKEADDHRIGL